MNGIEPSKSGRFDVFEPGDKTALVCMDVPEMERLVLEQLSSIGYKIHTGISIEDLLFKMRAHPYDVVVLAENFGGTSIDDNKLLEETINSSASQRHQQIVVLVGATMRTSDEAQSFQHSVDVVIGLADITNVRPVIRRAAQRQQEFYGRYLEAIASIDVA
jgi:CheY-like chemotaxis protein